MFLIAGFPSNISFFLIYSLIQQYSMCCAGAEFYSCNMEDSVFAYLYSLFFGQIIDFKKYSSILITFCTIFIYWKKYLDMIYLK